MEKLCEKNEEVEAGVLPGDSILDKYVKQHKDEIEADKFATRQYKKEELSRNAEFGRILSKRFGRRQLLSLR